MIDTQSPMKVIHTNCSLPRKSDNCSFVQFEALLNLADKTVCRCNNSRISVGNSCDLRARTELSKPAPPVHFHGVSIFAVTPTYTRHTQKVDLTSLCYNIQEIPDLIWIIVEDSAQKTDLVANLLQRCKVTTCSLNNMPYSLPPILLASS